MGDFGTIMIWLGSTPIHVQKEDVRLLYGDGNGANDLWVAPSLHSRDKYYLFNGGSHNATTITEEGIAAVAAALNVRKPRLKQVAA